MTLSDIKKACLLVMKTRYPTSTYKYYSNAVVEKFTRPCFFTELTIDHAEPASSGADRIQATFSIEILQDVVDEAKALEIAQTLRTTFGRYFIVQKQGERDRAVDVTGYDFEFAGTEDNIPVITVNLEWFDSIEKSETAELMKNVEVSIKLQMED